MFSINLNVHLNILLQNGLSSRNGVLVIEPIFMCSVHPPQSFDLNVHKYFKYVHIRFQLFPINFLSFLIKSNRLALFVSSFALRRSFLCFLFLAHYGSVREFRKTEWNEVESDGMKSE